MTTNIMTYLISYWILTTIYLMYWFIRNHPIGNDRNDDREYCDRNDSEYFTLLDILLYILLSMLFAPFAVPLMLLHQIKFKRK